jgi:hypothetical protein
MSRSIKIGPVIRRTLDLYVGQAPVLLSVAVISVLGPAAVVAIVLVGPFGSPLDEGSPALVAIAAVIVMILAFALFTGVVIELVADVHDGGGEVSVRRRLRSVRPSVLGQLILVGVVAGLVIFVLFTAEDLFVLVLIIGTVVGRGFGFGISVNLAGLILGVLASTMIFLIPALFLLTVWSVAAPVVVLERPSGLRALRRSRELVRGSGWRVFAVIAIFTISLDAVSRGIETGAYALGIGPGLAASVVIWTLAVPIPVLVAAVLYFELREATATDLPASAMPPYTPTPPADTPLPSTAAASDTA